MTADWTTSERERGLLRAAVALVEATEPATAEQARGQIEAALSQYGLDVIESIQADGPEPQ